jgi:hypothetical protein
VLLACGRAAHLPSALAHRVLLHLLHLLPGVPELQPRLHVLGVLLEIAQANPGALPLLANAVQREQRHQGASGLPGGAPAGAPPGATAGIVPCLQACLLQPCAPLQAAAAQLLGALARHAPPAVAAQLIAADACEYLFELVRGTLPQAGQPGPAPAPAPATAAGSAGGSQGGGAGAAAGWGAEDEREVLQRCAVAALYHLSHQGAAGWRLLPGMTCAVASACACHSPP